MSDTERVRFRGRAIAAAVVGNVLEWYDFIVYALLGTIIFRLFFPSDDPMMSLLIGFATFGIAFLARPLGGVILGIYADRYGRREALSLTFLIMAVATAMVAILPTHAAIGVAAPVLLVACRMLQGFSAGGEFGNATAVLVEFAPDEAKGFFGSLQMCSQALAVLVAAVIVFLLTSGLSSEALETWGWRVPFIIGALLGPVGLYVRSRMAESPEFESAVKEGRSAVAMPLIALAKRHRMELMASIGLFAAVTAPNYVNSVYLPSVAVLKHGIPQADAMSGVVMAAAVMVMLIPAFGWLSDRLSRSAVAIGGMVSMIPVYGIVSRLFWKTPQKHTFFWVQVLYAVPYAAFVGAACTLTLERFPVLVRATGSAVGYNIAAAAFGGMTPFWLALAETSEASAYSPAGYIFLTMWLGVAGVLILARRSEGTFPKEMVARDRPSQ